MDVLANAFFPVAGRNTLVDIDAEELPTRPTSIGPIFDTLSRDAPLPAYKHADFLSNYARNSSGAQDVPSKPDSFAEQYLVPELTSQERLRLSALWYHTAVRLDDNTIRRMRAKVAILKNLIGWEYAICGVLDSDHYERLVTAGLPLAILPRRESTCAHTVLQPGSAAFYLRDMARDWRFENSPHVSKGGLRTYAGAKLQCTIDDGQNVALGSVCVASDIANQPLTQEQLDLLAKFAEMLTADIVSASQQRRIKQQARNDALLKIAMAQLPDSLQESSVLDMLREVFPGAYIARPPVSEGFIQLGPDQMRIAHDLTVQYQLWEDDAFIDRFILARNHETSKLATHYIRAIIGSVQDAPAEQVLVVATDDISRIFDDVDIRFVTSCTLLLNNIAKGRSLKHALDAKERFMRGITHHLRTPIHGILASADLLNTELTRLDTDESSKVKVNSALENIVMIKDSGRNLTRVVNNMIRYNQWTALTSSPSSTVIVELDVLESQILQDIPWAMARARLKSTTVYFERLIPQDVSLAIQDASLLRDCLQPLVANALQRTEHGSVIITFSSPDDISLMIDILDTGHDASEPLTGTDFRVSDTEASELDLDLARQAAQCCNGDISMVSSSHEKGSHFRAVIRDLALVCPRTTSAPVSLSSKFAKHFCVIPPAHSSSLVHSFTRLLRSYGLTESEQIERSIVVVPYSQNANEYRTQLKQATLALVVVSLVPPGTDIHSLRLESPRILFFTGPFTSLRLRETLQAIDDFCGKAELGIDHGVVQLSINKVIFPSRPSRLVRQDSSISSKSGIQCLLVDDNPINLRILCVFCDQRRLPYQKAFDGLQAIEVYKSASIADKITLILLDLQMPNCDGIEACKAIREFEKSNGLSSAIIIIVTGQDTATDRLNAANAGADDFLVKPLSIKGLHREIVNYFGDFT